MDSLFLFLRILMFIAPFFEVRRLLCSTLAFTHGLHFLFAIFFSLFPFSFYLFLKIITYNKGNKGYNKTADEDTLKDIS